MNKKRVNQWINKAKEALTNFKIADDGGKIDKTFRGHISSFGAAVVMGSLKSAVAFYAEQGNSSVERQKLIQAMYFVITDENKKTGDILDVVCSKKGNDLKDMKEQFIDASIALKLAMNFFDLQ